MRFPLSVPALAAGALLATVAMTSPALANSNQAKIAGALEEKPWAADALGSSVDLICPEQEGIFGQSAGKFLMRIDAFDLLWLPPNLDLTKTLDILGGRKAPTQSDATERKQN